jgi:hypothetical protein
LQNFANENFKIGLYCQDRQNIIMKNINYHIGTTIV